MQCLNMRLLILPLHIVLLIPLHLVFLLHPGQSLGQSLAPSARRPFPQHVPYGDGIHIPDQVSRQQLDDSVRSFYAAWKKKYIRKGCREGEYYILFEGTGNKQCVSEGQGYGMLIVTLMAGSDSAARTIYDGLFRYYRSHPSKADPLLMAWAQKKDCRDLDGSSATDGDMDIAYSLLLADAQWGSGGAIPYQEEGRRMIAAIMKQEINKTAFSVLLSDDVAPDSKDYYDMRSSDFMPAHFRSFRKVSGDAAWDRVIDNNYRLFRFMQQRYSPQAGLFPDFINHIAFGADNPANRITGKSREAAAMFAPCPPALITWSRVMTVVTIITHAVSPGGSPRILSCMETSGQALSLKRSIAGSGRPRMGIRIISRPGIVSTAMICRTIISRR